MTFTDAELMLLFREGDDEAFEELIDRYQKRLVNFFYHLCWDYHQSEDMTQEVFIRLYKYRKKYKEKAPFRMFLFRIAKNLWIDQLRKMKNRPSSVSLDGGVSGGEEGSSFADFVADTKAALPSDGIRNEEMGSAIKEAVDTLEETDRIVFLMVAKEGLKYREVADILGIPEGTVKSKVYYTYRKLRTKLEELNPDDM